MKCNECGKPVDLKGGDEIMPGFVLAKELTQPDICKACFQKGWSVATPEDFMKDSGFTVLFKSPIQPQDLEV
jgi:hypothetical protein